VDCDFGRNLTDLFGVEPVLGDGIPHTARARLPNLRTAYLGSRTYGGHATGDLNPEPYAYESAFAARWLIRDQIRGDAGLNYDYYIKSQAKKTKRRQKRARAAAASATTKHGNPVEVVLRVKNLAREVGGIKNLKMLVDLLAE
jgi:hypothetical protein